MTHQRAIERIQQKVGYLESRLANPATDERAARFIALDLTAFSMALDSLRYLRDLEEYEKSAARKG